ncbi:MAG TPA: hypothetical protein VFR01_08475 [Geobacterales bacterium]|nr:hypothetical protein [Geobacterales bacterium]
MRKSVKVVLTVAVLLVSMNLAVFAAGAPGKVTASEKGNVTVTVDKAEAWLAKGAVVMMAGGTARVVAVEGTTVTLKSSKAAKLKAGDAVVIEQRAGGKGHDMQGC